MKAFLIGSCLVGLIMATSPAVADSDRRENHRAGFHQKVDHDRGIPHHKKLLSSRHRDADAHHGHRDRKHGWKNKAHNRHKHGWKHKKYHQKGIVTMATNASGTNTVTITGMTVAPVSGSTTTTVPTPWSIRCCRVLSY